MRKVLMILAAFAATLSLQASPAHPETENIDTLRSAEDMVTVHIAGSCRDVAAALVQEPALFEEKCASIYLNAGSSTESSVLEWNVRQDPLSYSRIFSARCLVKMP